MTAGVLWAMALGFGLGLRHAVDADHLATIGALLRSSSRRGPAATAALWALGHTAAFLAAGLAIVLLGLRVPPAFQPATELLVAALLILVGAQGVASARRATPPAATGPWRPLVIGLAHGLAGSAGVALLALSTLRNATAAALYLLLFGVGTLGGMVGLTVAFTGPLVRRLPEAASRWLAGAAGAVSVALGAATILRVVLGHGR